MGTVYSSAVEAISKEDGNLVKAYSSMLGDDFRTDKNLRLQVMKMDVVLDCIYDSIKENFPEESKTALKAQIVQRFANLHENNHNLKEAGKELSGIAINETVKGLRVSDGFGVSKASNDETLRTFKLFSFAIQEFEEKAKKAGIKNVELMSQTYEGLHIPTVKGYDTIASRKHDEQNTKVETAAWTGQRQTLGIELPGLG